MHAFKNACENSITIAELETLFASLIPKISAEKYLYIQFGNKSSDSPIFAKIKSSWGIQKNHLENYRLGLGGTIDPLINYTLKQMKSFEWRDYFSFVPHETFLNGLFENPTGYGLSLPVFGLNWKSGLFCIEFSKKVHKNTDLQNTLLQWACQIAHYRYLELEIELT